MLGGLRTYMLICYDI